LLIRSVSLQPIFPCFINIYSYFKKQVWPDSSSQGYSEAEAMQLLTSLGSFLEVESP
jgi:hypothetical protein